MAWIVQVALRRPYTFLVMALLILLATPLVLPASRWLRSRRWRSACITAVSIPCRF